MTTRQYFHRAAALPVALPLLAAAVVTVEHVLDLSTRGLRGFWLELALVLAISGAISVVPYLAWVAVQLRRLRDAGVSAYWRALWQGPIVVTVACAFIVLIVALVRNGVERGVFGVAGGVMVLGLMLGGFYAGLIALLHWGLARSGVIRD